MLSIYMLYFILYNSKIKLLHCFMHERPVMHPHVELPFWLPTSIKWGTVFMATIPPNPNHMAKKVHAPVHPVVGMDETMRPTMAQIGALNRKPIESNVLRQTLRLSLNCEEAKADGN